MKQTNTWVLSFLFPLFSFCFFTKTLNAQTNVRAWYADGQVWVVWEDGLPAPDWCEVYVKPTPFANTADALLVGKPHKLEYLLYSFKDQTSLTATARIPGPGGVGYYQLANNEGLFVFTPHQAGALYFAVVSEGQATVNPDQITSGLVPFQYNPVADPVECHLQSVFPSPFAAGFTCFAYLMWADGRQNQWESRPDFPIMANAAKNGSPSLFFISAPENLDTTQPFPLSVWLHGGGGTARQSLAGSRNEINIKPEAGILLAHNDSHIGYHADNPPFPTSPTWHFGWRKNYNPFAPGNVPTEVDTIVNYTQRRYLWIDQWLSKHFNIDTTRIHLHGHSMGSAGSLALAKCFPNHYASVTLFNTGCAGPAPGDSEANFGPPNENFPTNLQNGSGETIHIKSLFNLIDHCSNERDFPLIRHWHSKNDDNGTMKWSPYVIENYVKADSIGTGIQNMWSERAHGVDTGPEYNDHWVMGGLPSLNTALDNVNFPEARFRSNQSFPAFFNHRLDPKNNDPGTGLIGINNGDGDNWGAWGGYHRWDSEGLLETEHLWRVTAWLENESPFANDHCPEEFLTADMAIRRPQLFKPSSGATVYWGVFDDASNELLQNGVSTVQPDNLVVIPQIRVYREDIRKVKIGITDMLIGAEEPGIQTQAPKVVPNPSFDDAHVSLYADVPATALLTVCSIAGKTSGIQVELASGDNLISLKPFAALPAGVYMIDVNFGAVQQQVKWVKQ